MKNLWLFNKSRLVILKKLIDCQDTCGCDLRDRVGVKKPILSYHLKLLKDNGIVSEERCGREKKYRIEKNKINYIKKVIKIVG